MGLNKAKRFEKIAKIINKVPTKNKIGAVLIAAPITVAVTVIDHPTINRVFDAVLMFFGLI